MGCPETLVSILRDMLFARILDAMRGSGVHLCNSCHKGKAAISGSRFTPCDADHP